MDRTLATKEKPLLNQGIPYVSEANRTREDDEAMIYDAAAILRRRKTHIKQPEFEKIYNNTMRFFTETERHVYKKYQSGEKKREEFYKECANYLKRVFPEEMKNDNDFNVMMERIHTAIFQFDVIQPLIDDSNTSDIKICGPSDIRVRVGGKAYQSNATFLDEYDLYRFVEGLAIRNNINILANPEVTFTDNHDDEYLLRFQISSPITNAVNYPYLHIRKIRKKKLTMDDLQTEKMFNEDVKKYLIDRAKLSKGIIFAGPPGSGKTTIFNAWIEYIPRTREVLVLQENDELTTEQSGFMFKHVVNRPREGLVYTLEDLARMALVGGCNQFIIGEAKGSEMRYAATLLNSGGYFATTIHANNAYEVLEKGADLIKYGSTYSFNEARRMLKAIDTIVYMEGYKVREILECTGYDDETNQFKYVPIYRYEE